MFGLEDGASPAMQQSLRAAVRRERKGKKGPIKGGRRKVQKSKASECSPVTTPMKRKPGRPKNVPDDKASKGEVSAMKSWKKGSPPKGKGEAVKEYGCSRCRYAAKGCKTCKNPFRPRGRRSAKTD